LAVVVVELLDLQLADLADSQAVEAEEQHDCQRVGGVLSRGEDEPLELRLGECGGALGALGIDAQAFAVPARVAIDQREIERVGVQAADRRQAPLERLRGEWLPVRLGLGEVLGEVIAPHRPDVDGALGAPDEEGSQVGGVGLLA
jgi:hypothetical protein